MLGDGVSGSSSACAGAASESASALHLLPALRQSVRLLEGELRALKSKFDFNVVFTKQLEVNCDTARAVLSLSASLRPPCLRTAPHAPRSPRVVPLDCAVMISSLLARSLARARARVFVCV